VAIEQVLLDETGADRLWIVNAGVARISLAHFQMKCFQIAFRRA
jgi:hypothetical protein